MKEIRFDDVDDGEWVMSLAGGFYNPKCDHCLCSIRRHDDGRAERLGGFVFTGYIGRAISVHMGGIDPTWCWRDLLWMCFDYMFNRLQVRKALTVVESTNYKAMALDLRAGWRVETLVRDAFPTGHMIVLGMTREQCRWLSIAPSRYKVRADVGLS